MNVNAQDIHPHHFLRPSAVADVVVQACAWDDGGVEFMYGDGSVLSFCDAMRTFVALSPVVSDGPSTSSTSASVPASHHDGPTKRVGSMVRDMQFTAWTLSKYQDKVRAALQLYNLLSPHPRIIDGLSAHSEEQQVWMHRSPMNALLLRRDPDLLEHHDVYATVLTPERSSESLNDPDEPNIHVVTGARLGRGGLTDRTNIPTTFTEKVACSPITSPSGLRRDEVKVGDEWSLWCATRTVKLTIHSNGALFSVRWPAPVTHTDGSRLIFTSAVDAAGHRGPPIHRTRAYVWQHQVFPVAMPPTQWAPMLRLALEMIEDVGRSSGYPHTEGREDATEDVPSQDVPIGEQEGFYSPLELPATASEVEAASGDRRCRFSNMTEDHCHALIAAQSHPQRAVCNANLHGATAKVLWRYDGDVAGRDPQAVYWCLHTNSVDEEAVTPQQLTYNNNTQDAMETAVMDENVVMGRPQVLCAVLEDESVVRAAPHQGKSGYVVSHTQRGGQCTSKSYFLSDDGGVGLPPRVPLQLRQVRSTSIKGDGQPPRYVLCSAADAVSIHQESGGVVAQHWNPMQLLSSQRRLLHPGHAEASGRYLGVVGNHCLQLVEHERHAQRSAEQQRWTGIASTSTGVQQCAGTDVLPVGGFDLASTIAPAAIAGGEGHQLQRRVHPLLSAEEAMLADAVDGSAFRALADHPAPLLDSAVQNGAVVYLSTRLDGVGTFTALTNGTIRCCFDDRTILQLIPGLNRFDETNLVASCLYRDATRCSMSVAQCSPDHPMFRYVAYALPFRRHVHCHAAMQLDTQSMDDRASAAPVTTSERSASASLPSTIQRVAGVQSMCSGSTMPMMVDMQQLQLTTWESTRDALQRDEKLRCDARQTRVESILHDSDELSRINRSILMDEEL